LALDHYISQVHLRNFYSPALGERLYAVRKHDGKAFVARSEAVCRIEEGSTNAHLTRNRIIEEFLKTVEPKYNSTVAKLAAGAIDPECVYVVAGFAAYVGTCSPAGMRIHAGLMNALLESTALALDAANAFPPPPESLGAASLTELLQGGRLKFNVDPKYPQAVGIANVLRMTAMFGNSPPVRRVAQNKGCSRMAGNPHHTRRGRLSIYTAGKRRRPRITLSHMDRNTET
jgi:hypothetical protein